MPFLDRTESTAAHEVYSALGGSLLLGLVMRCTTGSGLEVSDVSNFARAHRDDIDGLRLLTESIAGFGEWNSDIFESFRSWFEDLPPSDVAPWLVFYSGRLEEFPVNLKDRDLVLRLAGAGMDDQLSALIEALVAASLRVRVGESLPAAEIRDLICTLQHLSELPADPITPYRIWRSSTLHTRLSGNGADEAIKEEFRASARKLELEIGLR